MAQRFTTQRNYGIHYICCQLIKIIMEMSIDVEGKLCYTQIYTGLGPIEKTTFFEEAVYQSMLNEYFSELYFRL
ncbi:MAG: hypothetical protein AAF551_09700 [Bacteroidota bacterium]